MVKKHRKKLKEGKYFNFGRKKMYRQNKIDYKNGKKTMMKKLTEDFASMLS